MHKENEGVYHQEYTKVHTISDQFIVYETGVSDENYGYTTYIVIESADNAYFFTVLPAMTPRMEEITPVVLGSMPMIIAVVFLLVLLSSRYFSGKIVHPIIRLANFAKSVRLGSAGFEANFTLKSKDEIGDLAKNILNLTDALCTIVLNIRAKSEALNVETNQIEHISDTVYQVMREVNNAVQEMGVSCTAQTEDANQANNNVISMGEMIIDNTTQMKELHKLSGTMKTDGEMR